MSAKCNHDGLRTPFCPLCGESANPGMKDLLELRAYCESIAKGLQSRMAAMLKVQFPTPGLVRSIERVRKRIIKWQRWISAIDLATDKARGE